MQISQKNITKTIIFNIHNNKKKLQSVKIKQNEKNKTNKKLITYKHFCHKSHKLIRNLKIKTHIDIYARMYVQLSKISKVLSKK